MRHAREVTPRNRTVFFTSILLSLALVGVGSSFLIRYLLPHSTGQGTGEPRRTWKPIDPTLSYTPYRLPEDSGFGAAQTFVQGWPERATLPEIAAQWTGLGDRSVKMLEDRVRKAGPNGAKDLVVMASMFHFDGKTEEAYEALCRARTLVEADPDQARAGLFTIIFYQGVTGLRRGENENCIMCRGESSCIFPISPAAVHINPEGSRIAIEHFTEYLAVFPDDLHAKWLLNLAHMTLGEWPDKVDSRYRLDLSRSLNSEFDIGRFRDIGHLTGLNHFNQSGGAIMEDFDNDGLLDVVTTSFDQRVPMSYFKNQGDGKFVEQSEKLGLTDQLGGLYCVQADYNNDGRMDIYIPRGAWIKHAVRPSLLRNDGERFTDVTEESGLLVPLNAITASWADYDNDGWLDLFVCGERQENKLFRNRGKQQPGRFEEVSRKAGVAGTGRETNKGAAWIDYDNDDYPDLFINHLAGVAQLLKNNRDGTFSDVTSRMGIAGPQFGFSCWAWDYNNDGWLDLFATSYDRTPADIVKGLVGQPHNRASNCLYLNRGGERFENVTAAAGLDMVFCTMGSNFGDFDNDGFLDMYLGTGEPSISTLVPNRMFKNVAGERFSEITVSAGVGHLQKGHGVACGDWDRDGNVDLFVEMGGAADSDRYHNILFQNPGHDHNWLTVKLIGKESNRAALGARIKVVTDADKPLTVHRHVSSGSSFGANPLQQTIGLGHAKNIAELEIYWPTTKSRQVFKNIKPNQSLEITEFETEFRTLDWKPVPHPPESTPSMKTARIP